MSNEVELAGMIDMVNLLKRSRLNIQNPTKRAELDREISALTAEIRAAQNPT